MGLLMIWILRRPKINRLALNLLLVFLLTQALSLIGADNAGAGLVRLEQYLLAGLLGVYIASTKRELLSAKLYAPLIFAVLFESILAILQFLKGGTLVFWILGERGFTITTPGIAKFDFYGVQFLRPYATFPHPNVLAAFMLVGALLLLGGIKGNKVYKGLCVVLGALTVLLTVSRTAIVAGGISALFLLKKKGRLLLLAGVLLLLPILYTRFAAVFNFDNLTLTRREELSGVAWQIFLTSPILGAGLNNFIPAVSDQLLTGPSRFLQPVHNIFLLALAETGVLGLLGLLGLLGYPIFMLFKLFPKPYPLNPILLIWAVIIFLGLFDHYFLTLPQGYRLLFLVWGISFSMLEWKNAKPS